MEQIIQYYAITAIRPEAQRVVPVWDLPTDDRAKIGKDIVLKKSSKGHFGKRGKSGKSGKRGGDDTPELITIMFWDDM